MYLSEGKFKLSVEIFFMLLFDCRMLLISLKRLIARPIATLSIDAQESHERKEKIFRDD